MSGRATFKTAHGYGSYSTIQSRMTSGKDQRGQTKLKFRQMGQASVDEIKKKDFRKELDSKEQKYTLENDKSTAWMAKEAEFTATTTPAPLMIKFQSEVSSSITDIGKKYDDGDVDDNDSQSSSEHDNSDDGFDSSSEESDEDDDDDDDDDDEEAQLQAELERIREERAAAQAKKAQEEKDLAEKMRRETALKSNPLVDFGDDSAKIKRRWNDDVVFRNQARDEPEHKKRFINDTIRSDFHRSFLKKFVH